MLTLKESTLVLAKIRVHHGNAAITDLEARTFHEELRADMTLGEALEAVKRFYADNSTGCWCGSGDVNAIVRRMRNESKPSEAQIARECEARGLSADEAWMYRRQRMLGNGPEQAQQQALTMRNPLELPAAQPKSRSTARPVRALRDRRRVCRTARGDERHRPCARDEDGVAAPTARTVAGTHRGTTYTGTVQGVRTGVRHPQPPRLPDQPVDPHRGS